MLAGIGKTVLILSVYNIMSAITIKIVSVIGFLTVTVIVIIIITVTMRKPITID